MLIVTLSGCALAIDRRAFVSVIGIDQSDQPGKRYKVTLKISLFKGDPKQTGTDFVLLSADAGTISEALYKARAQTDKKLFFGHTKVILFGEELARKEIRPLLDFFVKNREFQKNAYLAVAEPNAYNVLLHRPQQEPVAGFFLYSIFYLNEYESSNVGTLTLFDAYRREIDPALNLAMPIVERQQERIRVERTALFNKSSIQLKLSPAESRLIALLTTGVQDSEWIMHMDQGSYALKIVKGKASYSISESAPAITARLQIRMTVRVEEQSNILMKAADANMQKIEQQMKRTVQADTERLLLRIRDNKLDPIGFGLRYRSRHAYNAANFNKDQFLSRLVFKVSPVQVKREIVKIE